MPASWWALGMLLVAAVWWAFFVAGPPALAWAAGGVALGGVLAGLVPYGNATVTVDTGQETIEQSVGKIVAALERLGYLPATASAASR